MLTIRRETAVYTMFPQNYARCPRCTTASAGRSRRKPLTVLRELGYVFP